MSVCLNCGERPTIEAHLVPRAFVREVNYNNGQQHLIVFDGRERTTRTNTGQYDRELLCAPCDGILGSHEGYAHGLMQRLRRMDTPVDTFASISDIDGDRMVRFAAGIAWKFSATRPNFGRIEVGPYANLLKDVSINNHAVPASLDVALIRLMERDGDVYFYRMPKLDRQEERNIVRFSLGGFVVLLKIDKRPNGKVLPAGCWLRGRASGAIFVARAEQFEEGRMYRELLKRKKVSQFLTREGTKR